MERPAGPRAAALAREAGRLRGNRIWRVETPGGPVLQKLYLPKAGLLATAWRTFFSRRVRRTTGVSPEERRRTERELLAVWREAGEAVPEDLTDRVVSLGGPGVAILEFVEGRNLGWALARGEEDRTRRDDLLRRFCAVWGGRHRKALDRDEPRLVQVHGTLMHVLAASDRFVTIDLEQAYLPGLPVAPLVSREIVSYLRSLARGARPETLRRDLRAVALAYPHRFLLEEAVREHLESPRLLRRLAWAVDRRVRRDRRRGIGKYRVVEMLREALRETWPERVGAGAGP